MHFIRRSLLVKSDDAFVATLDPEPDLSELTVQSFLVDNLLPVTIGNIIGSAVMVGTVLARLPRAASGGRVISERATTSRGAAARSTRRA